MNAKWKRPRSARKSVRKTYRKKSSLVKTISRVAKTVALRQQETKHKLITLPTKELYHNATMYNMSTNLLETAQGVNDESHRIGDEITLRGLKLYIQFEDKYDRPNTTYRVVVAKCRTNQVGSINLLKNISGVNVIDPVDTETVHKVLINRRYRFGDKDTMIGTDEGVGVLNRPTTHFKTLWIPLNSAKYKYQQNSNNGTFYNIAVWVGAYDHSSMLTLDNIGSIRMSGELFFKDA